jgi:hypothetical protein
MYKADASLIRAVWASAPARSVACLFDPPGAASSCSLGPLSIRSVDISWLPHSTGSYECLVCAIHTCHRHPKYIYKANVSRVSILYHTPPIIRFRLRAQDQPLPIRLPDPRGFASRNSSQSRALNVAASAASSSSSSISVMRPDSSLRGVG